MPRSPVPIVATSTICLLLVASEAVAVCGGPNPPCARYWSAEAVFVGTVDSVVMTEEHEVHLKVVEGFRGVTTPTVTLNNRATSESVDFKPGETYFVYAYRDDERGVLTASICETTTLAQARDSLEYARWIGTKPTTGRIFGDIVHEQWDPARNESVQHPFPAGVTVTLTGPGGTRTTTPSRVGAFGRFQFDDLPVGTYELTVAVEGPVGSWGPERIELRAPQLCAETYVQLNWRGSPLRPTP